MLVVSPTPTHPQDHGNRKRLFELCRQLKRQGAKIHFVHYAAEHDWRHRHPLDREREMIDAWDSYHLVPPSRPLHEAAIGEDHLIDEWADPALDTYLRWAFRVRHYDVAIVAYTWMSFCFDSIPRAVFRICDTNDVFGNRRALLAAEGIPPEFFHTTPAEEAKGLARADLVWAIKESERDYFTRELGLPHCLTLLHAEPRTSWWQGPPSRDGWLRAGIIGARNNVNRRNIEQFLALALPLIEAYMAPVKLVLAGGCSDDFRDFEHPNVEIAGRVPTLDGFYREMDVILAPMRFSTGLKIKVAEALASGAPLLSTAHAMDGYPATDPRHMLPDLHAVAAELVRLSFAPEGLASLAAASEATRRRIETAVDETLDATLGEIAAAGANSVAVIAPCAALDPSDLLHDHLEAVLDYLQRAVPVWVYLMGEPASIDPDILKRRGLAVRVCIDPRLADGLPDPLPDDWKILPFSGMRAGFGAGHAYFLTECAEIAELRFERAYLRAETVRLAGGNPQRLVDTLTGSGSVILLASGIRELTGIACATKRQISYRRSGRFFGFPPDGAPGGTPGRLVVLATPHDPLLPLLAAIADRLDVTIQSVDPQDPTQFSTTRCWRGMGDDRLLVDLTEESGLAPVLAEGARRRRIPVLTLRRGRPAAILAPLADIGHPATVGILLRSTARGLIDVRFRRSLIEQGSLDIASMSQSDAGWNSLWKDFIG